MAAVATEAAALGGTMGVTTAAVAAALGVPAITTIATLAAVPTAATAAVAEALDNEACNTENWGDMYTPGYDGGPAA